MLLTRIDRTPVSRRKLFTPNGKGGRRKNGRITEIVHFYHAFILILSFSPSLSSVRVSRRSTKQDIRFAAIDIPVPTFYSCEFGNRYRIDDGFLSDLEKITAEILVFHVSVTFGMRICSTIFKVFGTRATPGSIALAIDFAQPPLGLRRPREGTRGGGKMRHRVSLEIRLQIYSSRSTRR